MGSADTGDFFVEADSSEVRPALGRRSSTPDIEVDVDEIQVVPSIPPPALPSAITQFAKYDVLGRIATGGMAELYLAREASELSSRPTVLKVLRQSLVESVEFEQMFLREGRVAMQLVHPNICTTYEFGRWRGHYYIAMEYIEGATLRDVLQRCGMRGERVPVRLVLHIVAVVAAALEHAHTARDVSRRRLGVVHRDISPHNIMIRFDGVVKLLDFGVAKVQQGEEETRSDAIKGKFGYLAPEQAVAGPVDPRTDVFALGIVLHETLTGRRLYKRSSEYESLRAILEEDPPPVADVIGEHGAAIEAIVRKALAKHKDDRYQTAGEMLNALEAVLTRFDVTSAQHVAHFVRPLFPEELAKGPQLAADETVVRRLRPDSLPPPQRTTVSPRSKAVIAAVAALGLLIGGAIAAFPSEGDAPADAPADATPTADATEVEPEDLEPMEPPQPEVTDVAAMEVELVAETEVAATEVEAAMDEPVDEAAEERRRRRRERRERNMRPGFTADPGF